MSAAAALALLAAPASAQEEGRFAEGSIAGSWGLAGEEKARFEARVVDVLCELTGDCPEDCGGGERQLGLLRSLDGALVYATKNAQPLFNGAAWDLLPYCGRMVSVDGNLVGADEANPAKVYQIQYIRPVGETGSYAEAKRWTEVYAERRPEAAKQEGEWFRNDPRVRRLIEEDGYLGLGEEADRKFIEENF